jgi:hypothetical protein
MVAASRKTEMLQIVAANRACNNLQQLGHWATQARNTG